MKIKRPTAKIETPIELKEFDSIKGLKIYDPFKYKSVPKELHSNDDMKSIKDKLVDFYGNNRKLIVGKLYSGNGNYIKDIELQECLQLEYGVDYKEMESTYDKGHFWDFQVDYCLYKDFKFKLKDNHLKNWLSTEEIEQLNAPIPQQLDDKGYLTLTEDKKHFALVDYELGVRHQELKDVYCSVNGRYIKYKGKNYYIKE